MLGEVDPDDVVPIVGGSTLATFTRHGVPIVSDATRTVACVAPT